MVTFRWRRGTTSICYSDRKAAEHDTVQRSSIGTRSGAGLSPNAGSERLQITRRSYIFMSRVSTLTRAVVYCNTAHHQKIVMNLTKSLARSLARKQCRVDAAGSASFKKKTHTHQRYEQYRQSAYKCFVRSASLGFLLLGLCRFAAAKVGSTFLVEWEFILLMLDFTYG